MTEEKERDKVVAENPAAGVNAARKEQRERSYGSPLSLFMKKADHARKLIDQVMPFCVYKENQLTTGLDVYIPATIIYYNSSNCLDGCDKRRKVYVGTVYIVRKVEYEYEENVYEALSDEEIISEAKHVRDEFFEIFDQIDSILKGWKEAEKNGERKASGEVSRADPEASKNE